MVPLRQWPMMNSGACGSTAATRRPNLRRSIAPSAEFISDSQVTSRARGQYLRATAKRLRASSRIQPPKAAPYQMQIGGGAAPSDAEGSSSACAPPAKA